ncbi:MAG: adenylate/guanylate cyclase domain-containing protein [Fidelibacterota bacterium]
MKEKRIMEKFYVGNIDGTVSFLDIENYLGITEFLSPEETHEYISKTISPLADCVKKHQGYVCQVQGDCIMAVFGHNNNCTRHALCAANCALEQQELIEKINPVPVNSYKLPLAARIGISSGPMYACYCETNANADYTVLGKKVNIAARLQKINKRYATNILIDETVFANIKENIITRELDMVKIDGCTETMRLYEVLSTADNCEKEIVNWKEYYEEGLRYYFCGEWNRAIQCFSRIEDDKASYMMIERCKRRKSQIVD